MDKAIQNCFDICPSSKRLGTGAVQSRADFNIRTEEVIFCYPLRDRYAFPRFLLKQAHLRDFFPQLLFQIAFF